MSLSHIARLLARSLAGSRRAGAHRVPAHATLVYAAVTLASTALASVTLASATLALTSAEVHANQITACTKLDICYCINTDYSDAIGDNVIRVRQLIASYKALGKAIGYLSVPLSPAGGGSFAVNAEASAKIADNVTARMGARSVWLLNPGVEGGSKMNGASGADYMYMWTQILEGPGGLGEDFDFFYFAGPTDFAGYFGLTGRGDLDRLEDWFDNRVAQDATFKKSVEAGNVTKAGFRNYYGLRASVAFSYGSHDEWNIARLINGHRRGATDFGIANQLSVLFDGRPVSPGGYESPAASGDVGRCIK